MPLHTVRQFLAQKMAAVLDHPPYSPDLAPADFFLFPRSKAAMKGASFSEVNITKDHVTAVLRSITREASADLFPEDVRTLSNVCFSGLRLF